MSTLLASIPPREVKALLSIAGKTASREYLNAIFLDPQGFAVATDGTALLALKLSAGFAGSGCTVPREACERALKAHGKARSPLEFHAAGETDLSDQARIVAAGATVTFRPRDHWWVDWQRVVPATFAPQEVLRRYDPELHARLQSALRMVANGKTLLAPVFSGSEHGAGILRTGESLDQHAVAILMGLRDRVEYEAPAFESDVRAFLAAAPKNQE